MRNVAGTGDRKGAYRVLVGGRDGKIPLGSPWRRWVDNIEIVLQEVG
jgi:dissimilatory sulfite reductase (desulfoviridin) alpha/beta subunit